MATTLTPVDSTPHGVRASIAEKRASMKKSARHLTLLAFAWVMLDALLTYFTRTLTGHLLPVNWILPLVLLLILLTGGWRAINPPLHIGMGLAFGILGFSFGPLLVPEISTYRYVELIGALCAFAIGYSCLRWNSNEQTFVRMFMIISGMYVVISIIALLKIAPAHFPVINAQWAYHGTIVMRPEVMTDQNFQVFYLFPVVLLLALPYRFPRFWIVLALTIGSLFVLAKLQTRSGMLVLGGTVLMCLAAPIWNRALGRGKLLALPLLFVGLIAIGINWILQEGSLILARFTDIDYQTGYGRLESFMYLFERVYNPLWWVPQGNGEFLRKFDTIPHSNVTAMFLEGGIAGLYMWIVVFLIPMIMLSRMFFRRQLDQVATLVLLGGFSMLIVQLSLNVPFFKQPWLWAGAVVGVLYRSRADAAAIQRSRTAEQRNLFASKLPYKAASK
jgi:hypothetical protein